MKPIFKTAVVAALTAGMLSLSALTAANAETLRFISWQNDDGGMGDWWRDAIAEFEAAHPGVTIDFTKVDRGSYADTMTTLFAGGQPPHIVHLASFEYQTFAENGWMENLDPWLAKDGIDMTGWAGQGTCRWNDETACIMLLYFGFIMAYNEQILIDAGVAVPTTWDEYLEASRTLTQDKDGDGITDIYGTSHQTIAGNQYTTEMLNYVLDAGAYWTDSEGKAAMNSPEMIEALTRWKTVLQEGLTPLDLGAGDVRQLFIEGKIAMRLDGPWLYGIIQKAEPAMFEQIKLTAPPFDPPVGGSSNVIGMASEISDEKKQLVWDFIEIVTSAEWQEKFAELAASPAPRPGAITDAAKAAVPHFDLLLETQQTAAKAGVDRIPLGLEVQFNEFAKIVFNEAQRMVVEDLDPAEVAERIQEQAFALQ